MFPTVLIYSPGTLSYSDSCPQLSITRMLSDSYLNKDSCYEPLLLWYMASSGSEGNCPDRLEWKEVASCHAQVTHAAMFFLIKKHWLEL